MPFSIQDQVCLVTGANRGIGKSILETLLEEGASRVYAAVRDPASVTELHDEHGDAVVPLELDLTKPATIEQAAKTANDTTLVVNNAGVLRTTTCFDDSVFDDLQFEIDVNVYGLIRIARAFAPVLKANGGGALVQLNSVASMKCFPGFTTYCASKAAAYSVTQALREQLAEQNTTVVSVHPGPIDTAMGHSAGLADIAEPPNLVAKALVEALRQGDFHVFPDSMARQLGQAYAGFAEQVIEGEMAEG